jgi:hypothetical protein
MTLDELSVKYGTDKGSLKHHYMEFYEQHLPKNPDSILEIGILKGASMRVWKEYFPDTRLYGLDLFEADPIPEIEGVSWLKGSQSDEYILYQIRNDIKPQIIIEDASHNCIAHWVTLYSLISCCEMYIIEDLHACTESFYRQGLEFEHTVLGAMQNNKFPFKFKLMDNKIAAIWK